MRIIIALILMSFSLYAEKVKNGDNVSVHYTGTLKDGSEFDSSKGKKPLEFKVGAGQMIAGFDKAVLDMSEGDVKKITIPSKEAYGDYNKNLVKVMDRKKLPKGDLKSGDKLFAYSANGAPQMVNIVSCDDKEVKIDTNHPMAGKDLTFEIELIKIK